MAVDDDKPQETQAPTANTCSIFGHDVSDKAIRVIAITAVVCLIIPTSDTWQSLPKILLANRSGITGFICQVLNTFVSALLALPMWLSVLLGGVAVALLLAALAQKVGSNDGKSRVALYVLCGLELLMAVMMSVASLDGNGQPSADEGAGLLLSMFGLLGIGIALFGGAALEIYVGIRLCSVKAYRNLGIVFIIYAAIGSLAGLISVAFEDYSVGAKVMDLVNDAIASVYVYFIYAALVKPKGKNDHVKAVIAYGLIIYAFLVMTFAIDAAYNPSVIKQNEESDYQSIDDESNDDFPGDDLWDF